MQAASNGCVQNGAASGSNGAAENGHGDVAIEAGAPAVSLSQANQDIVRLIGQYLKNEGLKWVNFFCLHRTFFCLQSCFLF